MKVYMFQRVYENTYDIEYSTEEEIFYTKEQAEQFLEYSFEQEIKSIKDFYVSGDETVEDYVDITDEGSDFKSIYMEDHYTIDFFVIEKNVMSI